MLMADQLLCQAKASIGGFTQVSASAKQRMYLIFPLQVDSVLHKSWMGVVSLPSVLSSHVC